jgi:hypothetical protein
MPGKYSSTSIRSLSVSDAVLTTQAVLANTMTFSFSTVCSSDNYDPNFRAIKDSAAIFPFSFTPRVAEASALSVRTSFFPH